MQVRAKTSHPTPGLEYKATPVADEAGVIGTDDQTGVVEAIVSVTGILDHDRDVIEPGAYRDTLLKRRPKGIFSHDWGKWASRTEAVEELMPGDPRLATYAAKMGKPWPEGAGGLYVRTRYNMDTQVGRDAYHDVKFFSETGECEWSVGYKVPPGMGVRGKDGIRRIRAMDLFEYSPVLFGANSMSGTLSVKDAAAGAAPADTGTEVDDLAWLVETLADVENVAAMLAEDEQAETEPDDGGGEDEPAGDGPDEEEGLDEAAELGEEPAGGPGPGDGAEPEETGGEATEGDVEPDGEDGAGGAEEETGGEAKGGPPFAKKPPKSGSGADATTVDGDGETAKIKNVEDLKNAIQGFGNVADGEKEKVRAHIMKRAFALKRPDLIPDAWKTKSGKDLADALLETAETLAGVAYQWPGVDENKRKFSDQQRADAADSGAALPDGSYPIKTVEDLKNAIQAVGRAAPGDRAKVMAHIVKRARALGHPEMIPDGWSQSGKAEDDDDLEHGPGWGPWPDATIDDDDEGGGEEKAASFNAAAHPRAPKGSPTGGQFMAYDSSKKSGTGYGKKKGDSRVRRLQKALNRLGFTDGKKRKLEEDGKLGPLTTESVKAAQTKLGMPATGKVTAAFLHALESKAKQRHATTGASGKPVARLTAAKPKAKPVAKPKTPTTVVTMVPMPAAAKDDAADGLAVKMTHEPLNRSPKKNWVEMVGQLPAYIQHIAKDLHEEKGLPLSVAIPTAIAAVKRWAAGGGGVNADTRAKAQAAVSEWEALKAKAAGRRAASAAAGKGYDPELEVGPEAGANDPPVEWRAQPRLPGSVEELRDRLHAAAHKALRVDDPYVVEVLGTWSDKAVVTRYVPGSGRGPQSFEILYKLDGDGVLLDDPVPVRVLLDDGTDTDLLPHLALLDDVADSVKTLVAAETKAGRVLSAANTQKLKIAVENLVAVLAAAGVDISTPGDQEDAADAAQEPVTPAETDSTAPALRDTTYKIPPGKSMLDPALRARAYRVVGDAHSRAGV